jgi:ParB-like chromosome segregation protein Spo0J
LGLTEKACEDHVEAGLDEVVSSIRWIESHSVTAVRVDSLVFEGSPRLGGEDEAHIRLLAESSDVLPPITVHRPTLRVIDGVHRVRAAMLNGIEEIDARLLDCDENVAFVLAVQANITHGLPLSQPDRAAAAARILACHPQWSDRAVAAATGLSDKTISRIRNRSTAETPQLNSTLGRDGRLRPRDSRAGRQRAAAMINDRPEAGLREIARATGLSAATVRDVRRRVDRGEDPVPGKYRRTEMPDSGPVTAVTRAPRRSGGSRAIRIEVPTDRRTLLAKLSCDPSLRFSDAGRTTLRWLLHHTVDAAALESLHRGLPDHWAPFVASLARSCAAEWTRLAEQLEQRTA